MSDYNSGFTGDRVVELLNMIPSLAKADLSNAMTVSLGQHGYAKFNNGLLIQWGYSDSKTTGIRYIYMPISFYNTEYVISTGAVAPNTSEIVVTSAFSISKYTSYFTSINRFGYGSGIEGSTWPFYWIAIGRWK